MRAFADEGARARLGHVWCFLVCPRARSRCHAHDGESGLACRCPLAPSGLARSQQQGRPCVEPARLGRASLLRVPWASSVWRWLPRASALSDLHGPLDGFPPRSMTREPRPRPDPPLFGGFGRTYAHPRARPLARWAVLGDPVSVRHLLLSCVARASRTLFGSLA